MKLLRPLLVAAMIGITLAGCAGTSPAPSETETPGATGRGEQSDAIDLVGLWRVSDAEGETADTWLRLDAGEAMLWRDCGTVGLSWVGQSGMFLAGITQWSGCGTEQPTAAWLEQATAYERDGDGWILRDGDGAALATLAIDGAPPPNPDVADFYTQAPAITGETHEYFRDPAPIASGLVAGDLTGRWVPEGKTFATDPFVDFADSTWTASDGCNGQSGRWVTDEEGLLLTTSGVSTLIGCEGAPVGSWVALARSAGFDGDTLVLANADGLELGRLVRG